MKIIACLLICLNCFQPTTLVTIVTAELERHVVQTSPCSVTSVNNDVTVDCTSRGIQQINPSWFPTNATKIFLDNNRLTAVEDFTFEEVPRLLVLSLASNSITTLKVNAFNGLENLQVLNLESNRIDISNGDSFPKLVLHGLKNLSELRLKQGLQITSGEYPVKYFTCQDSLTTLSIDTVSVNLEFGSEFLSFTRLTKLDISGSVRSITNSSFENFHNLTELYLGSFDDITSIDIAVFKPLENLDVLHIEDVPYGVRKILNLLWPFRGRNMTSILLKLIPYSINIADGSLLRNDSFLYAVTTRHLTSICLQNFSFINNQIYVFLDGALYSSVWDSCLREINLSKNPVTGTVMGLYKIVTLKNLQFFTFEDIFRAKSEEKFDWRKYFELSERSDSNVSSIADLSTIARPTGLLIFVLTSVRMLNCRRLIASTTLNLRITVMKGEQLELVDISDSGFNSFFVPILGLTGLRFLDMSSNLIYVFSEDWFDYVPKLETLVLFNCELDGSFMAKKSGRLFSRLNSLLRLDLSSNSLTILAEDLFANNTRIQMVRLADNRFSSVPFQLKFTPKLTFLDLTKNAITTIDKETRLSLDNLALGKEGFQLFLDGNILSCGCESLSFLHWLMNTHVIFDKDGVFSCMDQNGVLTNTSAYRNLDALWRKCWGEVFLYYSLVLFCLIIIGLLSTFVISKKLTYISHYIIQMFGGFKYQAAADYNIGVFIGYADSDYKFACHTLRAFVEDKLQMTSYLRDRDLLPSIDMARGIVDAINSSWRIVLVFNKKFLQNDDWMMFTFRSAIYAQTPANPNRVVVLVDENHAYDLPTELLNAVVEDNIVVVRHWGLTYELREKLRTRLCPTIAGQTTMIIIVWLLICLNCFQPTTLVTVMTTDLGRHVLQTSPCSVTSVHNDVTVDCTSRGIQQINPSWFPTNATKIFLDFNKLTAVEDFTFKEVPRLLVLSLASNSITTLKVNAFNGLENLQVLNLESNRIDISNGNSFPKLVLHGLKNLTELRLKQGLQITSGEYPVKYFTCQDSLTTLSIDTVSVNLEFGSEFLNFTRLTKLDISGAVRSITNSSFENFHNLTELCLDSFMDITSIDPGAFKPLENLKVLHVKFVPYGVRKILNLFWPFRGRNMTSILLKLIQYSITTTDGSLLRNDSFLYAVTTRHLTSICLQNFSFINNQIYVFLDDSIEDWFDYVPKLETLVLFNCELDGSFMAKKSGRLFSRLNSLMRLDLSSNSLTILAEDLFANNTQIQMMFGGFKYQTAADYKIGIFIGYADSDYKFACHTLRAFVEDNLRMTSYLRDRDLLPSIDMARGIVDAINSSWRIVLVFNKKFLQNDDWMMFTFRSAIYAQTPANPNRVVVLVDENHAYDLPTELLNAVVEDNIVVVRHWGLTYELREKLRTRLCSV
ncbi:toll-like receptor 4 [Physella acuta]|uniref:toll-like receptor 4 n=1 Tax=Physella acuta TaxID=109671 RepID=UPI0027DCB88D|nr:toll-like receptor 4 [Physella acuta]